MKIYPDELYFFERHRHSNCFTLILLTLHKVNKNWAVYKDSKSNDYKITTYDNNTKFKIKRNDCMSYHLYNEYIGLKEYISERIKSSGLFEDIEKEKSELLKKVAVLDNKKNKLLKSFISEVQE